MYKLHYIGCIPTERQHYITIVKEKAALKGGAETGEENMYIVLGLGFYFSFGFCLVLFFFFLKEKKDV